MKQFSKNICMIMLSFIFIFLLFKNPEISKNSIQYSFSLWLNNLMPSLFPMIIINDILINYNFPVIISKFFYNIFNKIFKLSYNGTYFFLMSLFIGTPTNAILLKDLIDKNMIEKNEANKLIYVCYFSNPLFLYNMLLLIFNSPTIAIKIIFIHYISNIILLFLIRNNYISTTSKTIKLNTVSLNILLPKSCQKAINNMFTVLGIISFYMLITSYLPTNSLLIGILEITTGLNSLILNQYEYKELITIIIINFGGLSIFTQIKSILEDTNLTFINFFKGRFYQVIISLILSSLI